jgi:hypothetical protein
MSESKPKDKEKKLTVDKVGVTKDTLTSRGGLTLFVKYIENIGVIALLGRFFGRLRKSSKGQPIAEIFKQLFCFFADGTSQHFVRFDALKDDAGYAAGIETSTDTLLSSHAVKRFFRAFSWGLSMLFREVLQKLFIWRLEIVQPSVITLGIDTMVMDNDEAKKRDGVQWTYKKVSGFQPLQMTWGRFVVDAIFRGGKKHGNHGDTVDRMVRRIVKTIREQYRADVIMIFRLDSGFMDQELFEVFEELKVYYTCSGKLYSDIKEYAGTVPAPQWARYQKGKAAWDFFEWDDQRGTWEKPRRAIFTRLDDGEEQPLLECTRLESVIYTNLGREVDLDERLTEAECAAWLTAAGIVELHHGRGRDELVHKSLKEFGQEALPFERFAYNTAYYYTMVIAHFLFECFKEDVCAPVVEVTAMPNTVRRRVVDIAAKVVRTGGRVILRVTQGVWNQLGIAEMWKRCMAPPALVV